MWGQHWGVLRWGDAIPTPALGFWGTMLLGLVLGVFGVLVLRSGRKTAIATFLLALFVPFTAMATVPFIFTNGQIADASQVNADFAALTPIRGQQNFVAAPTTAGGNFFASSPAFTSAPRSLTCLVTVDANAVAGVSGAPVGFNVAMQIGTTVTLGPASNLFFSIGPTVLPDGDSNYFVSYSTVFTVPAGASPSFGASLGPPPNFFQTYINAVYSCI
jgi:hypothetical protein